MKCDARSDLYVDKFSELEATHHDHASRDFSLFYRWYKFVVCYELNVFECGNTNALFTPL